MSCIEEARWYIHGGRGRTAAARELAAVVEVAAALRVCGGERDSLGRVDRRPAAHRHQRDAGDYPGGGEPGVRDHDRGVAAGAAEDPG
jgi:hypothetical protein